MFFDSLLVQEQKHQVMKNLYKLFTVLLLMIISASQAFAQIKDGEATVIQGSTTTISIGLAYQSTLNRATGINYTWTAGSSAISIQSKTNKTCTIKGNTPGTAKLNYHCSYYIDGYYRTMDFYYDITIKSNTISVTRIEMTPSSATLEIGETIQLNATAYPTNATNRSLNWTTENYSVASVSNSGLVTARGAGRVWIWVRATDGSGARNYCVVDVKEPTKVSSIELSETEATMEVGEELTITASILPDDANNKSVNWTSDNTDVAIVVDGVITAVSPGECNITCASTDGSNVSAVCHIVVNEPEQHWLSVVLPNGSFSINVTNLESIELKITPDPDYTVHSITVDGVEQDIAPNETLLTLPALSHSATVNVVFASIGISTNIEEITDTSHSLHLTVSGNNVTVQGLRHGELVNVYTINGESLITTCESSFTLNNSGVYIVRIGERTFKIAI